MGALPVGTARGTTAAMATPLRPSAGEVPAGMAALAAKQAEWASVPLAAKADMLQVRDRPGPLAPVLCAGGGWLTAPRTLGGRVVADRK